MALVICNNLLSAVNLVAGDHLSTSGSRVEPRSKSAKLECLKMQLVKNKEKEIK